MGPRKATLLESEAAKEPPLKVRKLRRTTTDEVVAKTLRDNFKDMSHMETDCVKVNGMSLREKLAADKVAKTNGTLDIKFGKHYYSDLRAAYKQRGGSVSGELAIKDQNEQVGEGLLKALMAWKGRAGNRQALTSWLGVSTEAPNQKEFVGVARVFLELRPAATVDQSRVAVEIMRWIARLNLHTLFPAETALLRDQFDATLVQAPSI
jgi:hypothetical protein